MIKAAALLLCTLFFSYAHAQLANPDFEAWDSSSATQMLYPHDWPLLENEYCTQSYNSQHGNFALMVNVWYYYVKTNAIQRAAINYKPASLDGYYTYTDNYIYALAGSDTIIDTALVSIFLTRWNASLMKRDTIGKGSLPLFQSAAYSHFSCAVNYLSNDNPDSVTIVLDPSLVRRYEDVTSHNAISNDGYCSFFTVDNLSLLTSATGMSEIVTNEGITIFPNPASDKIRVITEKSGIYTVTLSDIIGRECASGFISPASNTIDIKHLPCGWYQLMLHDGNRSTITLGRFLKQ